MSKKLIVLVVMLFVLIVVGMFTFTYLQKNQAPTEAPISTVATSSVSETYGITRIDATHYFIDGVHTIVGELMLPTPCDLLSTTATTLESMPEQVTFQFAVINTTDSCIQTVTSQRFKVSAAASNLASLRATFMGSSVDLNLTPTRAGETPEEFELFIKG